MEAPDGTLDRAFDSPEAKRRYNARLFTTIAARYDFITRLLSYGRDQAWKRDLIVRAGIAPGQRVLDLATGTGDLALAAAAEGAAVVGLDLAPRMVRLARAKPGAGAVRFLVGDMTNLPLPPGSVDVVTTGYGLRNVPDLDRAIAEIARVLRPGGRFLSLDFEKPAHAGWRRAYFAYLRVVGATVGTLLHGDPDTYRYIPASLARYPGGEAVAGRLRAAGFAFRRGDPEDGRLHGPPRRKEVNVLGASSEHAPARYDCRMLDAGEVRKRLRQTIEAAKREAAARRIALAGEQQAFDAFLENHAVPVLRHVASALKAEGHVFQVLTPAGTVRLQSDREQNDYLEIVLEATAARRPSSDVRASCADRSWRPPSSASATPPRSCQT